MTYIIYKVYACRKHTLRANVTLFRSQYKIYVDRFETSVHHNKPHYCYPCYTYDIIIDLFSYGTVVWSPYIIIRCTDSTAKRGCECPSQLDVYNMYIYILTLGGRNRWPKIEPANRPALTTPSPYHTTIEYC